MQSQSQNHNQPEIEYSEEEAMLAQSARELLAEHSDIAAVRRSLGTDSGYDTDLYAKIAQLGWLGVALPETYGGAGLRTGALVSLAEPIGQYLLASPFLATTLGAQLLLRAGTAAQKETWLPRLIRGQATATVALCEPSGSYALEPQIARAKRNGKRLMLSGSKCLVLDGTRADCVIAAVRLDEQPALVLLERSALQGRTRREMLVDETRRSAHVDLSGISVGEDALLDGGDALGALAHAQRVAWLLLGAEMAGGAESVLQLTLDYLRTRKQFGKPIGSYQSLKHPMVEITCALEQGRALLYHAATAIDREDASREIALRMAKAQLGDTFAHAADRSIQFHGAIGFTYECHAQLFFRRAQWSQYSFGDSAHHRQRLAQLMWQQS